MDKRYDELTDEQLVEEAQAESLEAEEYLIRKYKEVVRSRAKLYFIMGADGEDVVQEGMIGLFKAIKSYDCAKDASFHTFAELCINRQIITAIKTASRLKHSPLNTSISLNKPVSEEETDGTLEETLCSDSNSDPEAQLLLKDVVKSIIGNEGNIFSKFEMQVWNEYLTGKNYRQIAEGLGKSPKAVDNAIQRTKKKILAYLCQ
ncbi:RNA polymerase sporulation sigma factor SigH [Ihubacter massiliensis]|uniref:RNA polymerase sigma factor SigS n=1 Tax=Hominibacterium faecale TaxID=2839743 RepID=A0A9J6QXR9_9FIRM|nr:MULTISPECIES: RNA polymerase sporulation sigma factor SigH [Eubacteriales Family XIII. Incertae Sedis]MCI7301997.1 RNA polymerase sporulation sigma factor SigH [Clostridia bacterium]MDE8732327.1 RNA polymerase sporulation sigma factor SigH [Eubacteriales bacterium DFI.9.88]MDY3012415.1 RNA polymerase sporulation sigma factor SigH [Clostridiales Family XIII bacterium]MCO7122068.1 RNA polymerase sporulation sigma factor SigH [Ihubacter massiliensis]MCU7380274.1 RNA polymerase sporulation sigm